MITYDTQIPYSCSNSKGKLIEDIQVAYLSKARNKTDTCTKQKAIPV